MHDKSQCYIYVVERALGMMPHLHCPACRDMFTDVDSGYMLFHSLRMDTKPLGGLFLLFKQLFMHLLVKKMIGCLPLMSGETDVKNMSIIPNS